MKYTLNVNGRKATVDADDPTMPLFYALRDGAGLHGPRFGCGLGQCGACTVHVDGRAMRSCVVPISFVGNKKVVTSRASRNEPTAAVVPSAIANGIFDATGVRLRSVPFVPDKVLAALKT